MGAFGKGRLYKTQKRYAEAITAFEEALEREPDYILVLTELVNVEIASGDLDGAIRRLQAVIERDPEHRVAHDLLGIAYLQKEDFAAAEREFIKQSEINPDSSRS